MKIAPRFLASAFALAVLAIPASADSPPPTPLPDTYVRICDAYGAGYRNIPGTDICLRVGGYVQLDAVGTFGKDPAASGKDGPQPNR